MDENRKKWKLKFSMNYLVPYLVLVTTVILFRKGMDWKGVFLLYLTGATALGDLCFNKNKMNAIANWLLIGIFAGIILVWKFWVMEQQVIAAMCGFFVVFLFGAFWYHWKQEW